MKIYLDYIFLENLVVNTVIIIELIIYTNYKTTNKRKYLIIFLDTLFSTIMNLVPTIDNFIIEFLLTTITLSILFKFNKIIQFIKTILAYYLIYFIYIGLIIAFSIIFNFNLEYFHIKIILYFISSVFLHILLNCMWKMWKDKIKCRDLYYILKVEDVEINSFVDTGNNVKEPISNLNVIFLNEELKNKFYLDNYLNIKFKLETVNGISIKDGYIVENVLVEKDGKEIANIPRIIFSFSLNSNTPEKYSALIGYETYLENINGGVEN